MTTGRINQVTRQHSPQDESVGPGGSTGPRPAKHGCDFFHRAQAAPGPPANQQISAVRPLGAGQVKRTERSDNRDHTDTIKSWGGQI